MLAVCGGERRRNKGGAKTQLAFVCSTGEEDPTAGQNHAR